MSYTLQWSHDDWRLVVEDDDRTVYAYLLGDDGIVADVWLINRVEAPAEPPWAQGPQNMPFLNPARFVNSGAPMSLDPALLSVGWQTLDGGLVQSTIELDGRSIAWLVPGARPGWCRFAAADGPLAQYAEGPPPPR
jgi:hypothetical protein